LHKVFIRHTTAIEQESEPSSQMTDNTKNTDNSQKSMEPSPMAGDRIAKVLARAGIASRRGAERIIEAGRVSVNGKILKTAAFTVTDDDVILVDNEPLAPKEPPRLWRYHKPQGLMTTHNDPEGRPTVFERLPDGMPRVISVGRLDMNSEGLLLLTNDGELARQLELPSTAWARKYRARAYGRITQEQLDTLMKGIMIDGVKTGPIEATLDKQQGDNAWISITLREGKNREVRRALDTLDLQVNRLMRLAYGPFQLGTLARGEVDEVQRRVLRDQVGHFVEIPKGRPTVDLAKPRTKVKQNVRRVPKSAAERRRAGVAAVEQVPKAKNADKKNNAKWGKEKSAAMKAAKASPPPREPKGRDATKGRDAARDKPKARGPNKGGYKGQSKGPHKGRRR
jgi:23S rRNA pseudouridine2605 synthase